jgi:hypothetical protein
MHTYCPSTEREDDVSRSVSFLVRSAAVIFHVGADDFSPAQDKRQIPAGFV